MSLIVKRGQVPPTPHTEFYTNYNTLALEEIHGSYGFSGPYSRKLHLKSYPTEQLKSPVKADMDLIPRAAEDEVLAPYHILTGRMPYGGDPIDSRKALLFGSNTVISVARPARSMAKNVFFRNGEKHEIYYVQDGEGVLKTEFGHLPIRKNLYLPVPKGTTYQIELSSKNAYFLIVESKYPIEFPSHYLNWAGQAKLTAPVVETEVELPQFVEAVDEQGEFVVHVKHNGGRVSTLTLSHHPFDLVGWEGSFYPFGFDIRNHHGIAREIHTAPPMHQTFQSGQAPYSGFALCSFVPQMEGWHPKEVPAPYAHSNVDCDEVMFFSNADYGARKGVIEEGSITLHPGSLPHSPQGRAALNSLSARGRMSRRLAVMLDTFFEGLTVTVDGYRYRDKDYALSWHQAASGPDHSGAVHGT